MNTQAANPTTETPNAPVYAATIGVDWADQKHDLWIQPPGGTKAEHRVLDQTPEAIHAWVANLRARFPEQSVALAIETFRGALIHALHVFDFIVIYPINPKMLHSYRESFRVSGAKYEQSLRALGSTLLKSASDFNTPNAVNYFSKNIDGLPQSSSV